MTTINWHKLNNGTLVADRGALTIRVQNGTSYILEIAASRGRAYDTLNAALEVAERSLLEPYVAEKMICYEGHQIRLYPGDCGSTMLLKLSVSQDNTRLLLNRSIVVDGRLLRAVPENFNDYIGTTVQVRSPVTCLYTDGVCHTCWPAPTPDTGSP
jgi:hypothetical protein